MKKKDASTALTPLMQQYFDLHQKYRDAVLFFRLGDFYEMFDQDAHWVSKNLGLTLTSRHGYAMCGVPHHASESYIKSLLALGRKVAICEQIGIPEKGLVARDVVEVMTPGTTLSESILQDSRSNYLCAISLRSHIFSFSYIDISTGEFVALEHNEPWPHWLADQLDILRPKEILVQESLLDDQITHLFESKKILVTSFPQWFFNEQNAYQKASSHFGLSNLKGFGFADLDVALASAGALLSYLEENMRHTLAHVHVLKKIKLGEGLCIDEESRRNLELFEGQNRDETTSVFFLLNETQTAPGGRLLQKWMREPLCDPHKINERLDLVTHCYQVPELVMRVREQLADVHDVARLCGRISMDKAHAKDIVALKNSLEQILETHAILPEILCLDKSEKTLVNEIVICITKTLLDNPSTSLHEGKMVREGCDEELDYYQKMATSGLLMLEDYLKEEREATGLSLRLKENRVVGYYFEVNKAYTSQLPERFIHRQSMIGGERYTTEKMMRLQSDLSVAKDKVIELERTIFASLVCKIQQDVKYLLIIADKLALCDVITTFSFLAHRYHYCKPKIVQGQSIKLKNARHPVVERVFLGHEFIANDLFMDEAQRCLLITGPNMAGKSTYLRQNAIIVFMASLGCYVPADEAEIGYVDRIFCRVGSGDNLAKGESTFLTEMSETARILHYATAKSFVIIDEVGRGTGSNDGLAIARAILENLAEKIQPYLLFATHYHELTRLENPHIYNYSLAILEEDDQIYFLKKVKAGAAQQSYGIHVARLAGIPQSILNQADRYLQDLLLLKANSASKKSANNDPLPPKQRLDPQLCTLLEEISVAAINDLTPLEALNLIHNWQEIAKKIPRSH